MSVAFSPDGTKIVSGSIDKTIKVWDSGAPRAQNRLPWPKLTPVGLSGRQTGAAERENERAQRLSLVSGVFSGRNQDCVGIGRQYDQSLGFGCAGGVKIAPPWPKLTPAGLSGRQTGAGEREDERPQQPSLLGRVFPGRIEDCLGIFRPDDQSLGYGQVVSQRSFDVQSLSYHPAIRLAAAVAEQIQYEVSG